MQAWLYWDLYLEWYTSRPIAKGHPVPRFNPLQPVMLDTEHVYEDLVLVYQSNPEWNEFGESDYVDVYVPLCFISLSPVDNTDY